MLLQGMLVGSIQYLTKMFFLFFHLIIFIEDNCGMGSVSIQIYIFLSLLLWVLWFG